MAEDQILRVEADLETIRQAAGLTLPFGWKDVWFYVAFGVGGAVWLAWTLLPHGLPNHWGAAPLLGLSIVYAIWLRIRYRRSTGRSALHRREYTVTLVLAIVTGAAAVVYRVWAWRLGLSFSVMAGTCMFFVGLTLLFAGLLDRTRHYYLGLAIPLMACGLVIPFIPSSLFVMASGAMTIAGPAMAAIMALQLRRSRPAHAAD